MGPLVSSLGTFFFHASSHNPVNVCLIFKNKVSKSKLKVFYQTKQNLFIYLVSEVNNVFTMLCTFSEHPVDLPLNGRL